VKGETDLSTFEKLTNLSIKNKKRDKHCAYPFDFLYMVQVFIRGAPK
jgi:hypothetical protein